MADNIKIDLTGVPMVLNNLDLAKIVGAKKLGNRAASDQEAVGMLKTSCSFLTRLWSLYLRPRDSCAQRC